MQCPSAVYVKNQFNFEMRSTDSKMLLLVSHIFIEFLYLELAPLLLFLFLLFAFVFNVLSCFYLFAFIYFSI